MQPLLEIIAFNLASCRIIEACGAHRIELCANPAEGGTTPSAGFIQQARAISSLPLFPIIRPRGGHFVYDEDDWISIQTDIRLAKSAGCDGIVTGMLTRQGDIDKDRIRRVAELAYPMDVTFHRAFDRSVNLSDSLETIIDAGCTRVLSSGGKNTAPEGAETLRELVIQAADRIIILPGSGIKSSNIRELQIFTGASEFHAGARTITDAPGVKSNPGMDTGNEYTQVDPDEIKALLQNLQTT